MGESFVLPEKSYFVNSNSKGVSGIDMRVSDHLRGRREDFSEMGEKKTRGRKRNKHSAAPPSSRTLTSFLSRWVFTAMPSAGDRERAKLSCLAPLSSSCCRDEDEASRAVREEEAQFVQDEAAFTTPAAVDSVERERDRKPDAISFSLGMGAGLVFLIAKSATEFNKMVALRSEMEMMLKHIKDEIQIKAAASGFAESNTHSLFPNSNYWESGGSNKPPSEDSESCNFRYGAMEIHRQPHQCLNLDAKLCLKNRCEMEEELQVELQRLQLHLEGHGSSTHPHQDRLFKVDTESSESFTDSNQQVNEPKAEANKHAGVCPRELERRLHELLEASLQERISKLETALECTERKLEEKEVEICWWRIGADPGISTRGGPSKRDGEMAGKVGRTRVGEDMTSRNDWEAGGENYARRPRLQWWYGKIGESSEAPIGVGGEDKLHREMTCMV